MMIFWKKFRQNFSFLVISSFWLINLINPVFKKYDYGAEFPLVCAFGVLLLFIGIAEWRRKREKNWLEISLLFIFAAAVVISFVFSQTQNFGLSEVLAYLSMIPLYLFLSNQELDWQDKFLKVVLWGLVFAIVIGFVLYLVWPENRMVGPFFNILYHANMWPNAFALFLLVAWPVLLIDSKISRMTRIILLSLTFSALLLTFSRGAFIAFGGQLFLFLIYFFRKIRGRQVLTILLIGILSLSIFWLTNSIRALKFQVIDVKERAAFGESISSKKERLDFWAGSIELIQQKPIFGWGPFSFRYGYNPIQRDLLANSDHPHNIFLKIGVENGLIALGAFVAFLLAVFWKVVYRFKFLEKEKKNYVYILGVAVAGAFAHNLIDYNLNFFTNLLLLFIFMIFIRSAVAKNGETIRKPYFGLFLAVLVAIVSFYEGVILVLEKTYDEDILRFSLFPRTYYLTEAENSIKNGDLSSAEVAIQKQLKLNSLDSQAWHLKSVVECKSSYFAFCIKSVSKALELNPKNDFALYVTYFRALGEDDGVKLHLETVLGLLKQFFPDVKNNIHFAAYTTNVESAAELIDILTTDFIGPGKKLYWSPEEEEKLLAEKEKMLKTAEFLRSKKQF